MSFGDAVLPPAVPPAEMDPHCPAPPGEVWEAFGIRFSEARLDDLVREIVETPVPPGHGPRLLATANVDHIVKLRRDARFRAAYEAAWAVTIDGAPVRLYAALRGSKAPGRVTGADLLPEILARLSPERHRIFLVLGSDRTARGVRAYMRDRGLDDSTDHVVAPPDFGADAAYNRTLVERIRRHGTTHLFMGVGAPKSEIWMFEHRHRFKGCYGMALGASFDFIAGTRKRAPAALRRMGLEWGWRLACEPKRLARRYLVESWGFLGAVLEDAVRTRPR